jgi:NTP pyrophosphatase (non-canonical NTP hydrolase)
MDTQKFQDNMSKWQDKTFPTSTIHSIKSHLAEEMIELVGIDIILIAIEKHKKSNKEIEDNDNEESADIVLLLNHLAHKSGFNLLDEASIKFEKNKNRKWGKADENGVINHIKE